MGYCKLCEDYIGLITTQSYCEICRKTKNIQRIYGKEEILKILEDICLRDSQKRLNKVNNAIQTQTYSPECKKGVLTRVKSSTN